MSGYLDNYGVTDAKRERKPQTHRARRPRCAPRFHARLLLPPRLHRTPPGASNFFSLLRENKLEDAYRIWGCDPAQPCRDYNLAKFKEDWGPNWCLRRSPGYFAHSHPRLPKRRAVHLQNPQDRRHHPHLRRHATRPLLRGSINFQGEPLQHCADALGKYENFGDVYPRLGTGSFPNPLWSSH